MKKSYIALVGLLLALYFFSGDIASITTSTSKPVSPQPKTKTTQAPATTALPSPLSPIPSIMSEVTGISFHVDRQLVVVERVVDGDTIRVTGGKTVRYIGIDTPETVDPRKPVQCFGREASNRNKELVEGQVVSLEKDVSETDKYGRLLRYVYKGGELINEQLVREGFARSSTYPPDVKHQDQFRKAEEEARENNRGLWGEVCTPH